MLPSLSTESIATGAKSKKSPADWASRLSSRIFGALVLFTGIADFPPRVLGMAADFLFVFDGFEFAKESSLYEWTDINRKGKPHLTEDFYIIVALGEMGGLFVISL